MLKRAVRWAWVCLIGGLAAAFCLYHLLVCFPEALQEGIREGAPGDVLIGWVLAWWRDLQENDRVAILFSTACISVVLLFGSRMKPPEDGDQKKIDISHLGNEDST